MGLSLRNLGRKITDIFDANSQEDQRKRVAAGQPRMYADQQRAIGNRTPANNALQRGVQIASQTPVGRVVAPVARVVAPVIEDSPVDDYANLLGKGVQIANQQVVKPTVNQAVRATNMINETPLGRLTGVPSQSRMVDVLASQQKDPRIANELRTRGYQKVLDNAGIGINDSKTTIGRKAVSDIGGTAANFVPIGKTVGVMRQAGMPTAKAIATVSAKSGLAGAVGSGLATARETNSPVDIAKGAAMGAVLGGALPVAGLATKGLAKTTLKGAKVSAKATQDAIQAVRNPLKPLNEQGFIRTPGKDTELMVTHSTTPENFAKTVELGGMPQPSLGIVNPRKAVPDNFGSITLVGNNKLVDPKVKGNNTFNADIYSPTFPADYNGKQTLNQALNTMREDEIAGAPAYIGEDMSVAELRSNISSRFKNTQQILDNKSKLVDAKTAQKAIGVVEDKQDGIAKALSAGGVPEEASYDAIQRYLMGGYDNGDIIGNFGANGKKVLPQLDSLKKEIRNLSSEYFESVPDRAVKLNEFEKALIPDNLPKTQREAVVAQLNAEGIQPRFYKDGQRQQALVDLMDEDNALRKAQPTKNKLGLKKLNEGGFVANPFNKDGSLRSGVKKDQIFDGVDGKPRVEFNDSGAKILNPNGQTLGEVLDHPVLYKQYPELAQTPVRGLKFNKGEDASMDMSTGVLHVDPRKINPSNLLHEIQHKIQGLEKFNHGTNAQKAADIKRAKILETLEPLAAKYNAQSRAWKAKESEVLAKFGKNSPEYQTVAREGAELTKSPLYKQVIKLNRENNRLAKNGDYDGYKRNAGEAESRAVEARLNMTPEQRAKTPFYDSLDVPKDQLIVRNGDGVAMNAKTPKTSQLPKVALKQETAPQAPVPENNPVDSLPNNNTTKKVGEKTRGFQENIQRTLPDQPTAQAVIEAMPGYKPITNKGSLKKASDAIAENPQGEYARIITKNQLDSADDVVSGNLLLRDAIEAGDTETAIQLGTKLGIDGTKLGQAIQAYATFKKTTPEGIITYASKQARSKGNELDAITAKELTDKANAIAAMPESFEKAKLRKEMLQQADELGRSWTDVAGEVLNVPRAAMATADFSAPLRQGAILGSRFPAQFGKAFAESAKYMFKPDYYEKAMYDLTQRPTYSLMKSRKLSVDAGENLTGTEEQFLNNILEADFFKKIGVGHVVAASDRAYSGFLTKIRADVFDKVLADSNKAGVQLGNKELDSLAKYINSASGRGSGNVTNQVSRLQVLFSARLWKSRLDVLNPAYYARLDPTARKYALQSAASFAGIATTLISLAAAGGADVSADPRSADFGKIKVGNTRYDVLSGLQQNIRLAAQLISGEKVNSETGEVQTLGPERGFGKPSRLDILYQFVENKENPAIAFATKALRGTDPTGKPINLASEAAKLTIPLTAQGAYSTVKDTGSVGKGIAMNLPGVFGVGVQTYGDNKTKDKVAGGSSPDDQTPAQGKVAIKKASGDGYGLNRLSDGKYAYKFEGDDKIYTTKNLKDARDALSKDRLAKSGDNIKVVGDTVYRKNSEGKVTEIPKIKYDYQVGTATMTAQKNAGDLDGYVKTAQSQLANIDKQLKDPTTDPLEAAKLRNQATSLQKSISKYSGYGGFAKGKSGGRSRGSRGGGGGGGSSTPEVESAYKYAIKLKSSGGIPKPKVKAVASKKVKASGKVGKIKVSSKKSLV